MRENGGGKGYAPAMADAAVTMLRWDAAGATDRGRVRRRNEDAILVRPERRLFAVADGMGGHAAGNVASAVAVETLERAFPRAPSPRIGAPALASRINDAISLANQAILDRSAAHAAEAGMGTTVTVLSPLRADAACVIGHVGDSRAYRLRSEGTGEGFMQITRDHTWVQQQVDAGALDALQARAHPWSSILTRVLGMEQLGPADIHVIDVRPGDIFLLCSDGLTGMVADDEIAALLSGSGTPAGICAQLIAAANRNGGRDNISVIVLRASL
ncbi:MAG TPA: PP2C family serine/threonine-protein phosphatase [Longimicrobiales bacterium]